MPTKEEWIRVHTELMAKLKLPCKLQFFDGMTAPGRHQFNVTHTACYILINPDADFRVPEHLILHEAAHHQDSCPWWECSNQHCKHWAQTLCDMYKEAGIALPHTTGFKEFARAAGIVLKKFSVDLNEQMIQVARNPHLIEGA